MSVLCSSLPLIPAFKRFDAPLFALPQTLLQTLSQSYLSRGLTSARHKQNAHFLNHGRAVTYLYPPFSSQPTTFPLSLLSPLFLSYFFMTRDVLSPRFQTNASRHPCSRLFVCVCVWASSQDSGLFFLVYFFHAIAIYNVAHRCKLFWIRFCLGLCFLLPFCLSVYLPVLSLIHI